MKTVIYNPNNIDSILTSAVLQTMGWVSYSSNEVIDNEIDYSAWLKPGEEKVPSPPQEFAWVGVLPTQKHFPHEVNSLTDRHICYVKGANSIGSNHLLLPGTQYAENVITKLQKDVLGNMSNKTTLLDQVSSIEGINSNERHYLNYLISSFYKKDTTPECIAITTLNVVTALEALEQREPFTPIRLPEKGVIDDHVMKGMALVQKLKKKSDRVLSHGATMNSTVSTAGHTRVIRTYESKDWWFIRRAFLQTDIAFNICLSATGANVDAIFNYKVDLGVTDPMIVIS